MNGLALCAGDCGLELGLRLALGDEYRLVGAIEQRACGRASISRNASSLSSGVALAEDIRTHDFRQWRGVVDILSAGWPCQGFSTATRGRPTHPNLWPFVRRAIVRTRAPWVFLENINRAPWAVVDAQLRRLGFSTARDCFCPSSMGAPHRRPRTFLLAYSDRKSEPTRSFDEEMACVSEAARRHPRSKPDFVRMDERTPGRMDQFRLAGEGAIPAVAARAFITLSRRLAMTPPSHKGLG